MQSKFLFISLVLLSFVLGICTARIADYAKTPDFVDINLAFCKAVENNNMPEVARILSLHMPGFYIDANEGCALTTAITNQNPKLVDLLLRYQANPHILTELPVKIAARTGNTEIIAMLVSAGAHPEDAFPEEMTPSTKEFLANCKPDPRYSILYSRTAKSSE